MEPFEALNIVVENRGLNLGERKTHKEHKVENFR